MTQNSPCFSLFCLTHIDDGAFCDRFFRGSFLPVGEHCEPTGKKEPRKKICHRTPIIYVCGGISERGNLKNGESQKWGVSKMGNL